MGKLDLAFHNVQVKNTQSRHLQCTKFDFASSSAWTFEFLLGHWPQCPSQLGHWPKNLDIGRPRPGEHLLGLWRAGAWPAAVFREHTLKRRGVGVFSCLPRSRCARIPERRHCLHTLTLLQRALDPKRCTARGRMACGRALLTWPAHALRWLATACLSPPPHLAELA